MFRNRPASIWKFAFSWVGIQNQWEKDGVLSNTWWGKCLSTGKKNQIGSLHAAIHRNLYDFLCFKMGLITYPQLRTQVGKYSAKRSKLDSHPHVGSITKSVFRKFCILLNSYHITVQERPGSLEKDHYVKTLVKSSEGRNVST